MTIPTTDRTSHSKVNCGQICPRMFPAKCEYEVFSISNEIDAGEFDDGK